MVDVVGLRFVATGEQETVAALKRYNQARLEITRATTGSLAAIAQMESRLTRLHKEFVQGRIGQDNYKTSLKELKRQYADLAGVSIQKASAEVTKFTRALKAVSTEDLMNRLKRLHTEFHGGLSRKAEYTNSLRALKREYAALAGISVQKASAEVNQFIRALEAKNIALTKFAIQAQREQERAVAQRGYQRLLASIDPTVAASQRLAAAQEQVEAAIRHGIITAEEGAQTLRTYAAMLNNTSKANELLRMETEMLARAYNPAQAAAFVYQKEVEQLNRAHQLGVLSADELANKLRFLDAAYSKAGQSSRHAAHFVNQFGTVTHLAGVKTNRLGLYAQQVGYQVTDFFVQVQSGTNVFVAFGQQATQLAGLLPGVVGAIVGIAVAIGTTLLAAWDRAKKAQDEATGSAKAYEDRLRSLTDALRQWRFEREAASQGMTVDEFVSSRAIAEAEARLQEAESFMQRLQNYRENLRQFGLVGVLNDLMFGAGLEAARFVGFGPKADLENARAAYEAAARDSTDLEIKLSEERTAAYLRELTPLAQASALLATRARYGSESLEYARVQAMVEHARFAEQIRANKELTDQAKERIIAFHRINTMRAVELEFTERQAEAERAEKEAQDQRNRTAQERIQQFQEEVALNQAILQYGRDSAEVEALRRQQAMEAVEAYIEQNNLVGELAESYRQAAALAYDTGKAVRDTEAAMRAMSRVNLASPFQRALAAAGALLGRARGIWTVMGNIGNAIGNAERATAVARAQADALRQGKSPDEAEVEGTLAGHRFDMGLSSDLPPLVQERLLDPLRQAELQRLAAEKALNDLLDALNADDGGGGVGSGAVDDFAESFEQLRMSLDDAYANQKRFAEGQALLNEALRRGAIESDEYQRLLELLREEYPLVAAAADDFAKSLESIGRTMYSTIENSLMAIIDKSKSVGESFREMARTILLEAGRLLLVRPLLNTLFSFIGGSGNIGAGLAAGAMANANGNVFIGGNVIPFARGGVVNSPTYFPMSRGNVGLMGEAGPEAIMPLRRGPNGQLGVVARSAPVQVEVVGGDLVLSDDGRIMTQVRVIARQESNAAASRTITTLRTQPKAITGLR
jgi:hypothetical protein